MIINSLLDTDFYKLTMMQVVLHWYPGANVQYRFKCRTDGVDFAPYADEIRREISHLCSLRFQEEELLYLRQFAFFKSDFIDFLRIFQLDENYVHIDTENGFELCIEGPWLHTIMLEVPLLAILSEVYYRAMHLNPDYEEGEKRLTGKIKFLKDNTPKGAVQFSEFGTRRRFSYKWQEYVVRTLKEKLPENLTGTSNVYFAKHFNLKPIGTMAHEYIQAFQALGPRLIDSQKQAFETWAREYRGDHGIALSDVCGLNAFLRDFDLYFCKLFDGARHDSGEPLQWGERMVKHYQDMHVDPKAKTLVFSDNLSFPKAIEIWDRFHKRTNPVFGIGTNLTNDLGHPAAQIVIKMTQCNGQPVAKVSDSPGKTMCGDESYLQYLKKVFKIDQRNIEDQ